MIALALACGSEPSFEVREIHGGLEVVASSPLASLSLETADGVPVLALDLAPPAPRAALPARPPRAARWVLRAGRTDGRVEVAVVDGPPFPAALAVDVGGERWPAWDEQAVAFWRGRPATLRIEARRAATFEVTIDRLTTAFPLASGAVAEVPLPDEAEVLVAAGSVHVEVEVEAQAPDATPPRILAVRFPVDALGRARDDGTLAAVDLGHQGEERLCAFVRTPSGEALARLVPGGRTTALVPARAGERVELVPLGAGAPTDTRRVGP